MSAADRQEPSDRAASLAAACRGAGFVRLTATPDGDALAALGLLARALRTTGTPFQAAVAAFPGEAGTEADATIGLGTGTGDTGVTDGPLAPVAYAAARELGDDPDPALALAGAIAAGAIPDADADPDGDAEAADGTTGTAIDAADDFDRAPGVAVPTVDPESDDCGAAARDEAALADGVAHATLVHAPSLSGDPSAARETLAACSDDDGRTVASLVACAAVEDAPPRAAVAVERALRPRVGGPFGTLGGYADVLDAVARGRPGTAVALALDGAEPAVALDAWRDHGRAAHRAVRAGETARHAGCLVARVRPEAPLGTVARLLWGFRSAEPVVLVLADDGDAAAVHGVDAGEPLRAAATETGATATARTMAAPAPADGVDAGIPGPPTAGVARGIDDPDTFERALRGAL